jgi:hypothetical protein
LRAGFALAGFESADAAAAGAALGALTGFVSAATSSDFLAFFAFGAASEAPADMVNNF